MPEAAPDWQTLPLGEEPDGVIADRLRCSRHRVREARARLGIPAFASKYAPHPEIDWDAVPFSEKTDVDLSASLGVSYSAVQRQRMKRGLPVSTRPSAAPCCDLLRSYLQECLDANLAKGTLKAYLLDLNQFFSATGSPPIPERVHVERFKDWLGERKFKPASRLRKMISLSTFCRWLEETDRVEVSPVRPRDRRVRLDQPVPRSVSDATMRALLRYVYKRRDKLALRDQAIVELLVGTGMRVGELVTLNRSDLEVTRQAALIRVKGKGSKERHVAVVDAKALRTLDAYLTSMRTRDAHAPLFVNTRGTRISEQQVRRMLRGSGLSVTPHLFRHTFATRLINDEVDVGVIQGLLGHSSISTTMRYAVVNTAALVRTLQAHNPRSKW